MENKQNNKPNFKSSLIYTIHTLSVRDKIIWMLQLMIPIAVLITALLGSNDVLPISMTNTLDLALLAFLFLLCGLKLIRERMLYAVIYFALAALLCSLLIASFFIYH